MGCQTSKDQNNDIISLETEQQFKISYKELVSQDRGHVFELYHFSTILNRSNYSIVRKVISRASQQSRVCKIIPLVNQKYFGVVSQVQFMKKLDHPNIAQILEYFLQPSFLYIIMQHIPGQRILSQFNKLKQGVLFEDVVQAMSQILKAIQFCHSRQIAHRSISTQNILLFFKNNRPFVKLIDFSQACTIGSTNSAPIAFQKRNVILSEFQSRQTDKIDIYDCGIVFYSLLLGKKIKYMQPQVNYTETINNVVETIKKICLTKKAENDLIDLMTKMLAQIPKERPSALQCLNHPFFSNYQKVFTSKKALQSLMNFQPDNNLKYLLSMYASLNMTSAMEKAQHLSQFYNLDKNKDGEIQMDELVQGIQNTFDLSQQKAKQHAQKMFEHLDKNKSGAINFSQYITGTIHLSKIVSNSFLQKMFDQIDINRDGLISQQEVNNLIIGIDKYNILQGQKQVNFRQFKSMMIKMLEKKDCIQ